MATLRFSDVEVDDEGMMAVIHVASTHFNSGELTLCNKFINYKTVNGSIPGSPWCERCADIEGLCNLNLWP